MGETTGIQWTDHTFNPWWGCVKVSPACDNCYAEALAHRYGYSVWGKGAPRRWFGAAHWREPLKWNKAATKDGVRRRVFCASMADVFEDGSSDLYGQRANLWALIESTPMLDWQLLTKRPYNILRMVPDRWREQFPPNVWIGITAENQEWLTNREAPMRAIHPRVLFISYEPALGPITVPPWAQWVIAGGESGSGARPPEADWIRSVRDQCLTACIPFFFKQWGGFHPRAHGAVIDGREWKQFPAVELGSTSDERAHDAALR